VADGREDVRPPDLPARAARRRTSDQCRHRRLACRQARRRAGQPGAARARLPDRPLRRAGRHRPHRGRLGGRAGPQPRVAAAATGCRHRPDPDAAGLRPPIRCLCPRRRRPLLRRPRRLRSGLRRHRGFLAGSAHLGRRAACPGRTPLMGRLTFLLRPGWVALAVVVIAFTYLCFSVLAPWQLGKNTKTSRENDQIQQSLTTAPVPLKTLLPQQDSSAPDAQWRRVTATGHYLPDKQLVARLRVADGDPALEVLAPFVVDGGPTVLVDRGYVRPEPGSHVPAIPRPPAETVTLTARLRDSEPTVKDKEPFTRDDVQQVYSISTEQIATLTKVP